jgi:exodeoxyribonuclease VII small subunit
MNDSSNDPRFASPNDSSANDLSADSFVNQDATWQADRVSASPTPDWNYESTVAEVESIINRIEMGDLELAEVFDQFAIAVTHLHECETFLLQKKQQMDVLIETLSDNSEAF